MNVRILSALAILAFPACSKEAQTGIVKIGEPAPEFSATTTDGTEISTEKLKGKLVLVNFFATWCGPCLAELPHLETEVWQKFKDRGLALVVVGREHSREELVDFKAAKKFTMPFAPDPKREIYGKFATEFIPRNVLIGTDGKVLYQSVGFSPDEFGEMVKIIDNALPKTK